MIILNRIWVPCDATHSVNTTTWTWNLAKLLQFIIQHFWLFWIGHSYPVCSLIMLPSVAPSVMSLWYHIFVEKFCLFHFYAVVYITELLQSLLFVTKTFCYSSDLTCCSLYCISLQTLMSANKEVPTDVTSHRFVKISSDPTGVSAIPVTNRELLGNAVSVRLYQSLSIQMICKNLVSVCHTGQEPTILQLVF